RRQLAGLVGEIDQDGAALEEAHRLAAGTVGIDDRRDLAVRIERHELRRLVLVLADVDEMRLVGQADLLEHDRHLHPVRRRQAVELQPVGVRRGPAPRDRKIGECGHALALPWRRMSRLDGRRPAQRKTPAAEARMIEFFFDCSSPWTYLAFHNIQPLAAEFGVEIAWRPILVGGIFNTINPSVYEGREAPVPLKARYMKKDLADWARSAGIAI